MKPVARLALTLVAAFPVQRALLAVVALGSVAALGFALVPGGPPSVTRALAVGFVVATLFSALVTFPCFIACGTLFAALSAPRTFLLLPHFRRRLLAAVHVTFLVCITPIVALAAFATPNPEIAPAVLGYAFAFFTFFTLVTTLPPTTFMLAALALVPALHLLGTLEASATTVVVPAALAVASAVAWVAFARRYLRGAPIVAQLPSLRDVLYGNVRPPGGKLEVWQMWSANTSAEALTRNRAGIVLSGRLPARPLPQLVVLAGCLLLVALWLRFLAHLTPELGAAPWFLLPFAVVPPVALIAARAMQRARLLWLLGPQRAALFRIVENAVGRVALGLGLGAAVLAFCLAVWHEGLPPASAALVAGALIAYGALAVYLGLVFVRGFGAATVLAALLYAGPFGYSVLRAADAVEHATALAGSTVLALVAAAACRYVALRRWRGIDWIALRPQRSTSQRRRAAGV